MANLSTCVLLFLVPDLLLFSRFLLLLALISPSSIFQQSDNLTDCHTRERAFTLTKPTLQEMPFPGLFYLLAQQPANQIEKTPQCLKQYGNGLLRFPAGSVYIGYRRLLTTEQL